MESSFRSAHNFNLQRNSARFSSYSDHHPHSFYRHGSYPHLSSIFSTGMVIHHPDHLRMSSFEDRNAEDEKPNPNDGASNYLGSSRPPVKYESTREGDVVVVEPSFDADEGDGRGPSSEYQPSGEGEARTSPSKGHAKRGHSRNLSEHFQDATTLSTVASKESGAEEPYGYARHRGPPPTSSPSVGQKHRRVFSGEVSNPAEAHRRINSIGNSASVQRRPFIQERQHQRVDSAGLDILTAAADVSREELAAAAGERRGLWDSSRSGPRRSPIELVSYDHSSAAPPPPMSSSRGPPRGYAAGPPPPPPPPPYYSSHAYPQPPYPTPSFYGHSQGAGFQRTVPGAPPGGYPVQYARGADPYAKATQQSPLVQSTRERPREDPSTTGPRSEKSAMTPPPPVPPTHWRVGPTQGVQTYVTSIGVGDGSRTLQATLPPKTADTAAESYPPGMESYHHRKSSSISSWAPPLSLFTGPSGEFDHPLKGHHRATSSSVSFLGLDVGAIDNPDATFLKNLQASTGTAAPAFSVNRPISEAEREHSDQDSSDEGTSKLAPGGTSKRVRRKCNIAGCANRVVQGGLCISHGAKRKQCKHPGCNKNVKKAGLCSTHGPARKRCEAEGCGKVAVQGGRCIAHGAKKKLCAMDGCTKQAILAGMCKKHHDQNRKNPAPLPGEFGQQCKVIERKPGGKPSKTVHKPTHTRGLSLFQEMSAEVVGNILGDDAAKPPASGQHRHQSTFSRDFANTFY